MIYRIQSVAFTLFPYPYELSYYEGNQESFVLLNGLRLYISLVLFEISPKETLRVSKSYFYLFHRLCVHNQPYGSSLIFSANKLIYFRVISPSFIDSTSEHMGMQITL